MPEDGTALEPTMSVPGAVADLDAMDIDSLRTTLAETLREKKDLESNIGRQNRIHGEKLSALERQMEAERQERLRREQEMDEARRTVARMGMNPIDALKDELQQLRVEQEATRRQQQAELARQAEAAQTQELLQKAQAEGYSPDDLDTSSVYNLLVSIDVLDRKKQAQRIADLEARLVQAQEETVQTVAAVSGRQKVMTGSPAAVIPSNVSAEERALRERLTLARKGRRGEEVIAIKREALALGLDLSA